MTALSLTCIASVSAADVGTTQTQTTNSSNVQEKVQPNNADIDKPVAEKDANLTTDSAQQASATGLDQYLKPTKNCQVNDPKIKAQMAKITKGKTTSYTKAVAIFNWVRDNLSYSFYYNTKYGAVGTLKARKGNCCDHSHLLIALTRAAGIPARYVHGTCKFSSGTYGHVWAEVYVNGKWYKADATSSRNSFGVTKNWTSGKIKARYASLPF